MRILLADEAKSDLDHIPQKLRGQLLKKISYLSDFPFMGAKMEDAFKGFRCLLGGQGRYRVIYKAREKEIIIYYIRHVSRQLGLRIVKS